MTTVIAGHHGQADSLVSETLVNLEFAADIGFKRENQVGPLHGSGSERTRRFDNASEHKNQA
jgi:hypothetical protein